MAQGYPSQSQITTYLAAQGIEAITEHDTDWYTQYQEYLWRQLNRVESAGALSVYGVSTTTINAVSGKYYWDGVEATFTAGSAIDPTDNDTTYVWLKEDGTLGSAIDATGWPAEPHIKLAEVAADADGVITNIVDRRTLIGAPVPGAYTNIICDDDGVTVDGGGVVTDT